MSIYLQYKIIFGALHLVTCVPDKTPLAQQEQHFFHSIVNI